MTTMRRKSEGKPLSQAIDRDQVEAQAHMHTTNYATSLSK